MSAPVGLITEDPAQPKMDVVIPDPFSPEEQGKKKFIINETPTKGSEVSNRSR